MRLRAITIEKCRGGWYAEIDFTYRSRHQFTDEQRFVSSNGRRFWWLALIDALIAARRHTSQFEATKAERAAKGWAA